MELGTEDHMMEIQYWDESYDPVGAMFGYHNPVRLVKVESTKYFDMPDSNYGSESEGISNFTDKKVEFVDGDVWEARYLIDGVFGNPINK